MGHGPQEWDEMQSVIIMKFLGKEVSPHTMRCKTKRVLKRHVETVVLAALFFVLLARSTNYLVHPVMLWNLVDWETISTLAGIILITTGIRKSNLFDKITVALLEKSRSERSLAITLVIVSAAMATFLTNDIALLIAVPLTLSLQDYLENDISKIVVFEAIAANVGSALTPIGNPQNLFLWHRWGLPFVTFMREMALPVFLLTGLLSLFVWFSFNGKVLDIKVKEKCAFKTRLAVFSLLMLVVYVGLSELSASSYAFPLLFMAYIAADKDSIREANWSLVLIFILMFVDFHLIASVGFVSRLLSSMARGSKGTVFMGSILASQIISNVPAAILVSQFSHDWRAIAYGVNVGGNGLFIGSLANLIALKMVNDKRIWIKFHKYSIAYLLVSLVLVYFVLL